MKNEIGEICYSLATLIDNRTMDASKWHGSLEGPVARVEDGPAARCAWVLPFRVTAAPRDRTASFPANA